MGFAEVAEKGDKAAPSSLVTATFAAVGERKEKSFLFFLFGNSREGGHHPIFASGMREAKFFSSSSKLERN